jgi:nitroimidazol reductase NimA-like FMN-containing flavoprotein (pyridoxamine 5'-phosphate oxidase superfamily)
MHKNNWTTQEYKKWLFQSASSFARLEVVMQAIAPTSHTQVRRHPERAVYDLEQIHSILDQGYICHLGFVVDGQPFVIPTAYGRSGNQIYVHGSAASRTLRSLAGGINVCATVTLVDGFVLARSAFHHSMNYRSVVILGKAQLVTDPKDKMEGLRCLTNHLVPGRWEEVRPPNETEMIKTSLLSLPLNEVSAKVRSGPPLDLEDDYPIRVWAGVVPLRAQVGEPIADPHALPGIPVVDKGRFDRGLTDSPVARRL